MLIRTEQSDVPAKKAAGFETTRWSVVLRAGQTGSPESRHALESLCQTYWYPIYAFVRRHGNSAEDARDLTQDFFTLLLEKNLVVAADRQKGRFRSFLLTVLKRFLANEFERQQAQKRGGGRKNLSLDFHWGEERYRVEPIHEWTAERIFERRWALTLLQRVIELLQHEYEAKGKAQLFRTCQVYLTGFSQRPSCAETAAALGMSESAIRVAIHRLRRRYRELLTSEVSHTVNCADEIADELADLRAAIRGT